ncbi:MAG: hypothetical protein EAZ42_04315 [Verrucomicrobia bacterium]|nr:MAG: hypothetical protein EAZ42_04315 [Verrucomicrobiota bacterium]
MKTISLLSLILMLFFIHTTSILGDHLQSALKNSGENRSELENALTKFRSEDTNDLIAHASQYDLVNLTAEQIVENVMYARKVHTALPYLGEKKDDELWREWVLPHRVLDEDLELCRGEFYDQMQPVVHGKKTTKEVATAIHA